MNRSIKTLAGAFFAAITLFSCSSLSAQTDALVVDETGHVGVGLSSIPAQTREHILLSRQVGVAQNMLLFGQPKAPFLLYLLGVDADANGIVNKDDFNLWRSNFGQSPGNQDGETDARDLMIWQRSSG